jgi:hypothetical protein
VFPLPAALCPGGRGTGQPARGRPIAPGGFALAVLLLLLPWTVLAYRPAWSLVYVAWMIPLAELALLAAGQLHYRLRYREAPGKFRGLIIQVTTTGAEPARVNEIIGQIRGYNLTMDYRVWVVTEPGQPTGYPLQRARGSCQLRCERRQQGSGA